MRRPARSPLPWCLLGLVLILLVPGCGILSPEGEWARMEHELNRNRNRWERQGIASYSFIQASSCECIPSFEGPSRVYVSNGAITRVEKVGSGGVVAEGIQDAWYTVEELFGAIAHAIEERAVFLEVEYDPDRGFPTRMEVDLNAQWADDESVVNISGFRLEG